VLASGEKRGDSRGRLVIAPVTVALGSATAGGVAALFFLITRVAEANPTVALGRPTKVE
jgi:hypothetical protein